MKFPAKHLTVFQLSHRLWGPEADARMGTNISQLDKLRGCLFLVRVTIYTSIDTLSLTGLDTPQDIGSRPDQYQSYFPGEFDPSRFKSHEISKLNAAAKTITEGFEKLAESQKLKIVTLSNAHSTQTPGNTDSGWSPTAADIGSNADAKVSHPPLTRLATSIGQTYGHVCHELNNTFGDLLWDGAEWEAMLISLEPQPLAESVHSANIAKVGNSRLLKSLTRTSSHSPYKHKWVHLPVNNEAWMRVGEPGSV